MELTRTYPTITKKLDQVSAIAEHFGTVYNCSEKTAWTATYFDGKTETSVSETSCYGSLHELLTAIEFGYDGVRDWT